MSDRLVPSVFVVVLVILAGCTGGVGDLATGDEPDDGAAGASGDETGTETDSDEDVSSDDGDGEEVALVENRTAALRAAGGYTAIWKMEFSSEGEVVGTTAYTHAVDYENERSSFGMLMVNEDEVTNDYESFHADGTTYTRYGASEEATYQVADADFAPGRTLFSVESQVASGSGLSEFSTVGTETYDGVTVTRYERIDRPSWVAAQADDTEFTWTEFNYVVLVDADGLVRYESWGGDGVDEEGVEHTVTFSYSLTDVGSTVVEDPDWLAAADEQSNR